MSIPMRRQFATWALCLVFLATLAATAGCGGGGALPSTSQGPGNHVQTNSLDDWTMYAHDAHHTSASGGSVTGPLHVAWRYDPQPIPSDNFGGIANAIATTNGVYVHYGQYGSTVFAGGPSIDGVSVSGQRLWNYVEHRDYDENHWLALFHNNVVLQDDGQVFLNQGSGSVVAMGKKTWGTGFDLWGESIPDPTGIYMANTFIADGPDLFVYSLDASGAARWTANQQKSTKYAQDLDGGLILSGGELFYAASYTDPAPHASGIYAFDAANGSQRAYVATTPSSEMSADQTNIYLVENSDSLVARSQADLHRVWAVAVPNITAAAPVLADGLVIVATSTGIQARNASTGTVTWSSTVTPEYTYNSSTAMAAALGSNTLVVTTNNGSLAILSLATGGALWRGAIAGVVGTALNPVIVSDPTRGSTVYVTDGRGVIALVP